MYAVGLALGLQEISAALYKHIRSVTSSGTSIDVAAANALLFLSILFMIVRFFWSTGNIRRAIDRVKPPISEKAKRLVVLIHLPALLIQGTLVLFVCLAFVALTETGVSAFNVIGWFVAATAFNTAWLWFLTRGQEDREPESIWINNNLIFVFIGLVLMLAVNVEDAPEIVLLTIFAALSLASSVHDMYRTTTEYLSNFGR